MSFELLWSNLSTTGTVGVVDTRGLNLAVGDEVLVITTYTGSTSSTNTVTWTGANGFTVMADGRRSVSTTWGSIGITVFNKILVAGDLEVASLTVGTPSATPSYRNIYLLKKGSGVGAFANATFFDIGAAAQISHTPSGEHVLLGIGSFMNSSAVVGTGTFPDGTVQRGSTTTYAQAVIGSRDTANAGSWMPSFSGSGSWAAMMMEWAETVVPERPGRSRVKVAGEWQDFGAEHDHAAVKNVTGYSHVAAPSVFPYGISHTEANTANGWPATGTVVTTKQPVAITQVCIPQAGGPIYTRAAASGATTWGAWTINDPRGRLLTTGDGFTVDTAPNSTIIPEGLSWSTITSLTGDAWPAFGSVITLKATSAQYSQQLFMSTDGVQWTRHASSASTWGSWVPRSQGVRRVSDLNISGTVTVSSIPQTGDHLMWEISELRTTATGVYQLRINGISTATYRWYYNKATEAAGGALETQASLASASTNGPATFQIFIPNYSTSPTTGLTNPGRLVWWVGTAYGGSYPNNLSGAAIGVDASHLTAVTSLTLIGGNSGRCRLYSIKDHGS